MAHTNIAWNIFQGLETVLTTNIKDATVKSVYRFPDGEDDSLEVIGKHNRAILLRLESEETVNRASDCEEYEYVFLAQIIRRDTLETQEKIMDLSEEVKYWFYQNTSNDPVWFSLDVSPVIYEAPEQNTNIKRSQLSVTVKRRG